MGVGAYGGALVSSAASLEVIERQLVHAAVGRTALGPGEEHWVRLLVPGAGGRVHPVGLGDLREVGGRGARPPPL